MNTLVVGGSGFLGRHLVARLRAEGASVRVYSRHPQQGHDGVYHTEAQRNVKFISGEQLRVLWDL